MLKKSLARFVEKDKLSLIGVGFEIKDLVEMDLHCIASVLSTVPLATLAGESSFEVYSPSAATCVSFCATWLRQHKILTTYNIFGRKEGRKFGNDWLWQASITCTCEMARAH